MAIDLYRDMIDCLNAEVDRLSSGGFEFEKYADWNQRRIQNLCDQEPIR